METLDTQINPNDERFIANDAHNRSLAAELRERLAQIQQGGSEQYRQRHHEQGKLFVRDRIDRLLDPGSPFLELSPLAAWGMYSDEAPSAGIVTGIGRMSPLILDNLGILTGGAQAFQLYAFETGRAADEISDAEKKQLLLNTVLNDATTAALKASQTTDDAATGYERLGAAAQNLKTTLGDLFVGYFGGAEALAGFFDNMAKGITLVSERGAVLAEFNNLARAAHEANMLSAADSQALTAFQLQLRQEMALTNLTRDEEIERIWRGGL